MYFEGGYTYSNFLINVIAIFAFVVWFWLLVVIYGDLFRRHDISGWGKALWVIVLFLYSPILASSPDYPRTGDGRAQRLASAG